MESAPAKRSKFTYRHLHQLSKYSVDTPLRVIALVDLDAFYAQCEMKRLGVPAEQPLAVQQWQNLIAVNYPARDKGVSRHITGVEAKKLCPDVRLVHVATWKAGESHWSYSESVPNMADSKACLDPYRAESKKILSVFHEVCSNARIEKASIDESFLDLSKDIHGRLLQQYKVLRSPPNDDFTEHLPLPDFQTLDWSGSHLVANPDEESEKTEIQIADLDWDDIAMAIGAGIVKGVRNEVFTRLGYTCSAGIANNKMMAKLGSGFKKPNQQTVVRASAVQPFLSTFKFTKIRNLGGKLGTQIAEHFKTESLVELLDVSLGRFQSILSDDTATYIYNVIRGIERSPVTPQMSIKSMLSAKSFRDRLPSSISDAQLWLKVFVSDIWSRLEDEGVMEGRRRPKTMTISFTNKAMSRNRQTRIPSAGKIEPDLLLKVAEGLLRQVAGEGGGVWPCIRMSLQVGGFEDKEEGNMGIGAFLLKGDQAKEANKRLAAEEIGNHHPHGDKKRKIDDGIGRFFGTMIGDTPPIEEMVQDNLELEDTNMDSEPPEHDIPTFTCPDCNSEIPIGQEEEHKDWHFAKALALEDKAAAAREREKQRLSAPAPSNRGKNGGGGGGKRKGKKDTKVEKGQSKLMF
ncbi:DNA/RNA polymerase [Wilcoxina mikolae CBS 423.85]|nr:DNA/RNA polymerase [Wilcoxina mikolae CBS 423.85]